MLKRGMCTLVLLATLIPATYAAASKGEFEYWSYWDEGHPNDQYMRSIVKDFEQETGIDVKFTSSAETYSTRSDPPSSREIRLTSSTVTV